MKKIKEYQSGLGISDDEYWNTVVFNQYKDKIAINNLIRKENNKNESYSQTINRLYNGLQQSYNVQKIK